MSQEFISGSGTLGMGPNFRVSEFPEHQKKCWSESLMIIIVSLCKSIDKLSEELQSSMFNYLTWWLSCNLCNIDYYQTRKLIVFPLLFCYKKIK